MGLRQEWYRFLRTKAVANLLREICDLRPTEEIAVFFSYGALHPQFMHFSGSVHCIDIDLHEIGAIELRARPESGL